MLTVSPGSGPDYAPASRPGTGLHDGDSYRYLIRGLGDGDRERSPLISAELSSGHPDRAVQIEPGQRLSYAVFPVYQGQIGPGAGYASTAVGVDLEFDDGSWLTDYGVVDQAGYPLDPDQQYASRALTVDQWNIRTVSLDSVVGKRVLSVAVSGAGTARTHPAPTERPRGGWLARSLAVIYDWADVLVRFSSGRLLPHRREIHGWISDVRIEGQPNRAATLVDLVDTRRGSHSSADASRGNTIPAVAVPNGFNFGIPVTDASSLTWPYRYHDHNAANNATTMQAFAVSHSPSPWIGDRGILQVMPVIDVNSAVDRTERSAQFRHANEIARPHHYAVVFENALEAELTATDHVVLMQFRLPAGAGLVLDQPDNRGGLRIDTRNSGAQITGFTDSRNDAMPSNAPRMFFALRVDQPIRVHRAAAVADRPAVSAVLAVEPESTGRNGEDHSDLGYVTVRVATSFVSVEQALRSLRQEAPVSLSFQDAVAASRARWENKLASVQIDDGNHDRSVSFASSLYRLFLYPNSASENAGTTDSPDWIYADTATPTVRAHTETETGCTIRRGRSFVNNGFWDTYRTAWPAYSLLAPELSAELLDGFVEHFRASGWVERWSAPGAVDSMVGTSSDIVIADAVAAGVEIADLETAYDSALRNATTVSPAAAVGRADNVHSVFRGYVSTSTGEGLSWTMEGAINDFGIARLSQHLADRSAPDHPRLAEFRANASYFEWRALWYRRLFDRKQGFFVGRRDDGSFRSVGREFDPRQWGGDYTETNAWGMAFTAPHDGVGLAALYGGRAGLEAKLDEFFSTVETGTAVFAGSYGRVIHEMREARDIRQGMFGLSNQPAHHIPYLYAFAGAPHKTQAIVRESIRRCFLGSEIGQGYPGDEDNGEMSAWYVFGAIGLYPLTPGSGELMITSPSVARSTITFPDGVTTTIVATPQSVKNIYIQAVQVDGVPWNQLSIPIALLRRGVLIEIGLGAVPSDWGSETAAEPYSFTRTTASTRLASDLTSPESARQNATIVSSGGSRVRSGRRVFDDSAATGEWLSPEDSVVFEGVGGTLSTAAPPAALYTVTLGEPCDRAAWVIEARSDGLDWTELDRQDAVAFRWPIQTRAFVLPWPGFPSQLRLRVTGECDLDLRQLEFVV